MKNPCVDCSQEYFRCRHICPIGIRYQMAKSKEREIIKKAKAEEGLVDRTKIERILETKRKAGLE